MKTFSTQFKTQKIETIKLKIYIAVDCGPGAVPDMVYSCSMCMPYNEMGCGAECKGTPSNSCIPFDWIHCGNGTYAKACDMCNAATGIANATGCEAVDGDCKWAPDNTCVLAGRFFKYLKLRTFLTNVEL